MRIEEVDDGATLLDVDTTTGGLVVTGSTIVLKLVVDDVVEGAADELELAEGVESRGSAATAPASAKNATNEACIVMRLLAGW